MANALPFSCLDRMPIGGMSLSALFDTGGSWAESGTIPGEGSTPCLQRAFGLLNEGRCGRKGTLM
ncbi:hypothetical protein ETC04_14970 [Geobacillus sp. MR]|uniref:Uncharacterized protein n=1 Tax=Geobacillus thermodenitrificans (strain NG80-2) TaxID=420246 RepID=A4IMN8_GEOTN|nr:MULTISPECIES: hypothetical protein [Geobacillus]ABO66592.1 hypothetical protein GTNG_1220 [Geobacillus thermodenitrificans NG80-2]NNU88399.1 hypothetical protein [Geobacillus sp. MR]